MEFIRQLFIRCKDKADLAVLYTEVKKLCAIEYISHSVILECINLGKYDYIEDSFDFSAIFYFSSACDIDKYCLHPIHQEFVENVLKRIDIMILDYSIYDDCLPF